MILRKSWWECRFRVLLAALLALGLSGFALLLQSQGAPAKDPAAFWSAYCMILACFGAPTLSVMLAGSGINSQTAWGMLRGFHPSMYFLLSLPVSRRRALFLRAALGAAFTAVLLILSAVLAGALAPSLGGHVPLGRVLVCIPFILVSAFGFYGLSTFLTIWLDEFWAGSIGMSFAGFVFGLAAALWKHPTRFNATEVLSGEHFLRTGEIAWPTIAVFLAIGVLSMAASVYLVERKEY